MSIHSQKDAELVALHIGKLAKKKPICIFLASFLTFIFTYYILNQFSSYPCNTCRGS